MKIKPSNQEERPARRRSGASALVVAWAVLGLGIAGAAAWVQFGDHPANTIPDGSDAEAAPVARAPAEVVVAMQPAPAPPPEPAPPAPAASPPSQTAAAPPPAPAAAPPAPPPPAAAPAAEPPLPNLGAPVTVPTIRAVPPPPPVITADGAAPPPPLPAATRPPAAAAPAPNPTPAAAAPPPTQAAGQLAQAGRTPPPAPRARGNQPLWLANARAFDANDRRPRIAVVLSDLGLAAAPTEAAIRQMPGEVTLAFSPYAENLDRWVSRARSDGHEVLINLPMEPANYPQNDPGPQTLLTTLSARENLERLEWVLGRASGGYVGVNAHLGSKFTTQAGALRPVLEALNAKGLMLLDSRASTQTVAPQLAAEINLPRAVGDRFLDQDPARSAIDARLAEVERIAKETGNGVAIGTPLPVTYERIALWLPTLAAKGFVLAPVSAVANRQPER